MTSQVAVLKEPSGYVVACFDADCPEHGAGTSAEPWLDDYPTQAQARAAAAEHREFIRNAWLPVLCESCGQRVRRESR